MILNMFCSWFLQISGPWGSLEAEKYCFSLMVQGFGSMGARKHELFHWLFKVLAIFAPSGGPTSLKNHLEHDFLISGGGGGNKN